jgi:hypothetical protein
MMRTLRCAIANVGIVVLLAATAAAHGQSDPLIGRWSDSIAKSRYEPGPPPVSVTLTYQRIAEGYAWVSDGVDSQGRATHSEGTIVSDGIFRPASGGRDWDELSFKPIDAFTSEVTRKKNGRVVQTALRVLSHDGTTLTITTEGVDASGRRIHDVVVYEKQTPQP